jgi:hypothetical protein
LVKLRQLALSSEAEADDEKEIDANRPKEFF